MTAPQGPTRILALVDKLARGDRSTAFALHALISAADSSGEAEFDHVALIYRDDHLAALRVAGRDDAQREAGRLSLDEVRQHLARSVFPRLVGDGVIIAPPGGISPSAKFRFADHIWQEIASTREAVAIAFQRTGEHISLGPTEVPVAPVRVIQRPVGRQSILEAKGLVKTYRRRRVVNDVALRLQQGEIVGLLGPNGAGKTTTFYMIVGLIEPLAGNIELDGVDITKMPMYKRARRGIGYLSQEP